MLLSVPRRFALTGLLGLAFGAASLTGAGAQTSWDMAIEYPAGSIQGQGVAQFARLVAEKSNGRLTIKPIFDAQKGRSSEIFAKVQERSLQAGDMPGAALATTHPFFALSSLPFVTHSIADAKRLADVAGPTYRRVLQGFSQRLLYASPAPPAGIWSKNALATPADLKGLAIRTSDGNSTAVFNAAGARARNLPLADLPARLKDGSVTAALVAADAGAGRRLWEDLPHFLQADYAVPLSFATVNAAAYEALPADVKRAVDEAARETEASQWAAIRSRTDEAYGRMRDSKVTVQTSLPQDLRRVFLDAARPTLDDWRRRTGADGAAVLESFRRR